jgi:hypothetical protein
VDLAETNRLLLPALSAHTSLAYRLSCVDDYAAVREHFLRGAELAKQAGLAAWQISMMEMLAWFGLHYGEFKEVEQTLAQARLLREDLNDSTAVDAYLPNGQILFLAYQGQWTACTRKARAQQALLRGRGIDRAEGHLLPTLGLAILESRCLGAAPYAGAWKEAEAALAEATEIQDRSLSPQRGILTRALWGSLCLYQSRFADARRLLAEANEVAQEFDCVPRIEGHRLWLAAQVAVTDGDWVEALNRFESACKVLKDAGARWWWARVRLDWAEAHASRGQPSDRQRAAELLREARDAFQDMGVPRYAAIAQERLQELATALEPGGVTPGGHS